MTPADTPERLQTVLGLDNSTLDFLSGGGEMGARIRAFDWSSTPLGPAEAWPQSLKTAVNLILNSQHAMWIGWGPAMTYLYNDAYVHVLGTAKNEWALGRPASEVWAEIWHAVGPLAERVFRQGAATFVDDMRLFMSRGHFLEETYYSYSYSPIRDESGRVGGLFCPSTDVSPKVIGARRLRTLSELSSNALVERTVQAACATAAATLGRNPDDIPFALLYLAEGGRAVLRQTVHLAHAGALIAPDEVPLGDKDAGGVWPLAEVFASGKVRAVSVSTFSALPKGPAGQPVTQALVLPVISRVDGSTAGVLIAGVSPARRLDTDYLTFFELAATHVGTAIQNARAAEEEKRRLEAMAELDRAKTAFFSNVSHEFRTPLTLMLGPIETLLANNGLDPGQRSQLETAHRNSLRLLKLVNSLLDFSRIEAGRVKASYEPVDLAAITTDLASNFRSALEAAGLEFVVDCPPLPQPVYVDREMWEKIVLNLLSNAFKFTFEGRIALRLDRSDDQALLTVADTGVGIPASELPTIFERFHRVEGARGRTYEGTGIGLALTQELVKLHGGVVKVESSLGTGSVFSVALPFGHAHLPQEQIGPARSQASTTVRPEAFTGEALTWLAREPLTLPPGEIAATLPSVNGHSRPRVLVADDNADMREHIAHILGPQYDLVAVPDGVAALLEARRSKPDLILTDVMMPQLDGFGFLRELRADPELRDVFVILLSARAGEEARTEGLGAGADDYLTKPFSAKELAARVRTALELQRVRREARQSVDNLNAGLSRELAALARMQQLSIRLIQAGELDTLLDEILKAAIEITQADKGNVQLLHEDVLRIAHQHGFDAPFLNFFNTVGHGASACGTALQNRERVVVEDVSASPIFQGTPASAAMLEAGARAVQSTPLVSRSGRILGVLSTHYGVPKKPSDRDLRLLDILARQAADLIERSLAEQALQDSERWQLGQKEAFQAAVNGAALHVSLGILTRTAVEHYGGEARCAFYIADASEPTLRHVVGMGDTYARCVEGFKIGPHSAAWGLAAHLGRPVITPDVFDEPRWHEWIWLAKQFDFRGCWTFPVETSTGKIIGAFAMYFKEPRDAASSDHAFAAGVARAAAIIISQAQETQERKQAADALGEATHELQQTLETAATGLTRCSRDFRYLSCNPAYAQIAGLPRDQIVGRLLPEVMGKQAFEIVRPHLERVLLGERVEFETLLPWAAAGPKWIRLIYMPWKEADGSISGWVASVYDISIRKQAEERLRAVNDELRRVAHLLEPVACFVRDPEERIVYWNPGAAALYGFSTEEAIGQIKYKLLKTEFPEPLDRILAQVRTSGSWDGELLHTCRDGRRIAVASHWALHTDADDRPVAILEVNVDITQRKAAEEALRVTNAALVRANEDLNQFAFAASHDLQEPLRMITSYSQLLLRGYRGQLDGEAATCIEFISEGTKRMRRLLADLLAYTQLTGDRQENFALVDLNVVFLTALENCKAAAEDTGAIVTSGQLPAVLGHQPHFIQLFQNLISNGIKYRSEQPPRIHVSAERHGGSWRIAVKDNGIGIAPEYRKQIFGVFKRLHGKNIPGTGIGLAICQRVVDRCGGQIWVESQPGQGATFYFTLPAADQEAVTHAP